LHDSQTLEHRQLHGLVHAGLLVGGGQIPWPGVPGQTQVPVVRQEGPYRGRKILRAQCRSVRLREDPFIAQLDERLAAIMNGPPENGEGLQVLHYGPGGVYPPHFDFLVPSNPAVAQSIARSGQRVSTLIVYLNDVIEGGETVFPEVGFSVVPRRGNGVYFEYTNSRMQVDPRSAHGGAPVIQGEKWIVTKWMRSLKFVPSPR
jgi:prolyl 4-hydroxylase